MLPISTYLLSDQCSLEPRKQRCIDMFGAPCNHSQAVIFCMEQLQRLLSCWLPMFVTYSGLRTFTCVCYAMHDVCTHNKSESVHRSFYIRTIERITYWYMHPLLYGYGLRELCEFCQGEEEQCMMTGRSLPGVWVITNPENGESHPNRAVPQSIASTTNYQPLLTTNNSD